MTDILRLKQAAIICNDQGRPELAKIVRDAIIELKTTNIPNRLFKVNLHGTEYTVTTRSDYTREDIIKTLKTLPEIQQTITDATSLNPDKDPWTTLHYQELDNKAPGIYKLPDR